MIDVKSLNINWYPGHMKRTFDNLKEQLKIVDIIIEVRDARIPMSSSNPLLNEITSNKPRLIILNKKDECDLDRTNKYLSSFEHVILTNALNEKIDNIIVKEVKEILKDKLEKAKAKGIRHKVLRAAIVGIPNVGKSTIINKVVKKNIAKTENRPGVTKKLSWIKIHEDVELLDTPGVLWPKIENPEVGVKLAILGSINDDILDKQLLVNYALDYLNENYHDKLVKRYGEIDTDKMLESICRNMGWIKENNEIDLNKAYEIILKDIRNNKIPNITWE